MAPAGWAQSPARPPARVAHRVVAHLSHSRGLLGRLGADRRQHDFNSRLRNRRGTCSTPTVARAGPLAGIHSPASAWSESRRGPRMASVAVRLAESPKTACPSDRTSEINEKHKSQRHERHGSFHSSSSASQDAHVTQAGLGTRIRAAARNGVSAVFAVHAGVPRRVSGSVSARAEARLYSEPSTNSGRIPGRRRLAPRAWSIASARRSDAGLGRRGREGPLRAPWLSRGVGLRTPP